MTTEVVVTGLGAVTPVGNDIDACWAALVEGKGGIGEVEALAEWTAGGEKMPVTVAGAIESMSKNTPPSRNSLTRSRCSWRRPTQPPESSRR